MQRLDDAIASVTGWAGGWVAWMELRSQPQRHPVLLLMDPVLWLNSSTQSIFSFKTSIPISQSTEGAEKCIVLISGIIWTLPGKGLLKALQDWCASGRNQSKWAEQSQPPRLFPQSAQPHPLLSLLDPHLESFSHQSCYQHHQEVWCGANSCHGDKLRNSQNLRKREQGRLSHKQILWELARPDDWLQSYLRVGDPQAFWRLISVFHSRGASQLLPLGLLKSIPFVPYPPQRLFCRILIVCWWVGHPSFRKYLPPQHLPSLPFRFTVTRSVGWFSVNTSCFWIREDEADEADVVIHSFKN